MATSIISSLVLAGFLIACAQACTQIIIGGPGMAYPTEVMSSRNMGFFGTDLLRVRTAIPRNASLHPKPSMLCSICPATLSIQYSYLLPACSPTLQWDVVSVPAGFSLVGMPIARQQPLFFPKPTRYGMVCVAPNTRDMASAIANFTGDAAAARRFSGLCSDGMNEAGLSAAYLWDSENAGYANSSDPVSAAAIDPAKESVSYFDYPSRVLAECDSIECARALTARLNIVTSGLVARVLQQLIGDDVLPMHATFCDKSARCIGVEWTRPGRPEVFDLKQNAFTNEPQMPTQERMYADYMSKSAAKFGANAPLNWPGGTANVDITAATENDIEPSSRYIRMAMLMQLYGPVPYPNPKSYASPAHYGSKISAFAQINSIMGYAEESGAAPATFPFFQWKGQMSQFVSTRDHLAGDFYIRLPSNQQQHRINVRQQTLIAPGRVQIANLDVLIPAYEYATETRF